MALNLNFFPALKARIGPAERGLDLLHRQDDDGQHVVREIKFAHEFDLGERSRSILLGDAIQRALNNKRIRESICRFLQKDHRFFSSLVAGVLDGNPEFFPVNIAGESEVEKDIPRIRHRRFLRSVALGPDPPVLRFGRATSPRGDSLHAGSGVSAGDGYQGGVRGP